MSTIKPLLRSTERDAGFSLVEVMVAMAIMGVVAVGTSNIYHKMDKSARAHAANEDANSEMAAIASRLKVFWDQRTRTIENGVPIAFSPDKDNGFTMLDAAGSPCSANCTSLTVKVTRKSTVDTITFTSFCGDPGPAAAKARLATLNYAAITANACLQCPSGRIPMVSIRSDQKPAENQQYPLNGMGSTGTFSINKTLGMMMCFEQSGIGPVQIDLRAFLLNPHATTDAVKGIQHTVSLPYDNFGGIGLQGN